jgi:hypothetical protein
MRALLLSLLVLCSCSSYRHMRVTGPARIVVTSIWGVNVTVEIEEGGIYDTHPAVTPDGQAIPPGEGHVKKKLKKNERTPVIWPRKRAKP